MLGQSCLKALGPPVEIPIAMISIGREPCFTGEPDSVANRAFTCDMAGCVEGGSLEEAAVGCVEGGSLGENAPFAPPALLALSLLNCPA
ncbi:hypothetical protein ES708_33314 [subsurface metagenome]